MDRPIKSRYKPDRETVELMFDGDLLPSYLQFDEHGDEYNVRGAVVWPEGTEHGYLMIGAQRVDTGVLWLFEERRWWTVSPGGDGPALTDFWQSLWDLYYCRSFYVPTVSEDLVHKRYLVQALREALIDPKPVFVPAVYAMEEQAADALVAEYVARKLLRIDKEGQLYQQLQAWRSSNGGGQQQRLPAVLALRCLLAGYERRPWRDVRANAAIA